MADSIVYEKSKIYAIRIIGVYKNLCNINREYVMSKQLLRSPTSIGANLAEAVYASSKKDFLNKIYISLKEASESSYWLELLYLTGYLKENDYRSLEADCREIIVMLNATTKTIRSRF